MKHLKHFENRKNSEPKYKNGDYVLFYNVDRDWNEFEDSGKIVEVVIDHIYKEATNLLSFYYVIEFIKNPKVSKRRTEDNFSEDQIIRLLTPEEIEEYKLKQIAKNYNL